MDNSSRAAVAGVQERLHEQLVVELRVRGKRMLQRVEGPERHPVGSTPRAHPPTRIVLYQLRLVVRSAVDVEMVENVPRAVL